MKEFILKPEIRSYISIEEFVQDFKINSLDIVLTGRTLFEKFIEDNGLKFPLENVFFIEDYGQGEPNDNMIDCFINHINQKNKDYRRIVAIGGGTVIDIAKIAALEFEKCEDLFLGKTIPKKKYQVIAVPATCGTGSEVTGVAIAHVDSLGVKKGISGCEIFCDYAVMIPQLLSTLPEYVFFTSAADGLIHGIESYLSPSAGFISDIFAVKCIELYLKGFRKLYVGENIFSDLEILCMFQQAALCGGISFSNAGCAAVHALSYSIGGTFHVPHGEANWQFFSEVMKMYRNLENNADGKFRNLEKIIANNLECDIESACMYMDKTIGKFIGRKKLREYGMTYNQIDEFTNLTIENQQRLLVNSYIPLSEENIKTIFINLY